MFVMKRADDNLGSAGLHQGGATEAFVVHVLDAITHPVLQPCVLELLSEYGKTLSDTLSTQHKDFLPDTDSETQHYRLHRRSCGSALFNMDSEMETVHLT